MKIQYAGIGCKHGAIGNFSLLPEVRFLTSPRYASKGKLLLDENGRPKLHLVTIFGWLLFHWMIDFYKV
jgi:hypothetical protein